jgi:dTDP-4-amino-4,6-dideoxy-D-galactose acyltransferase
MDAKICEYLDWDSELFELRIARYAGNRLSSDRVVEAASWCQAHQIDCLYFLADSDDAETVRLAEANGFHLVDIRLMFQRSVPEDTGPQSAVRAFRTADAARLRSIARISHRDSRFYYDGGFPESRCDDLYDTWIERSYSGWADAVLVAEADGSAGGYVTCHLAPSSVGSIGLLAVAPECRGRKLGSQLTKAALEYFRVNGMKEVTVVTQGRNVGSQRLYQRCGFVTGSVQLWYHKWFGVHALP